MAENVLERSFQASKPNDKWAADITEFSLFGQKLYLSPILDLYSCDVVSYSICEHPYLSQLTGMLEPAFGKIPDNTQLIPHSDQGWRYRIKPDQRLLKAKGIRQSMSRKDNCLDNAVIENFFGLLKTELFYLPDSHSLNHFKAQLIDDLDCYNRRIKAKRKGLPPALHRKQALSSA